MWIKLATVNRFETYISSVSPSSERGDSSPSEPHFHLHNYIPASLYPSLPPMYHMDLLRNSCAVDAFLFFASKLNSMSSSLGTLLTLRCAKKAARLSRIIDHDFTDHSLNQQDNNTNASNNDISSDVTYNASNSTVSHTRKPSLRKNLPKPANIQLDHSSRSVIHLSNSYLYPLNYPSFYNRSTWTVPLITLTLNLNLLQP